MRIELSLSRLDTRPHSSQLSFTKISLPTVRRVFLNSSFGSSPLSSCLPDFRHPRPGQRVAHNLPTLVYRILPPTTAIVDYAMGLEKLSANEQFFDDAQTAVCNRQLILYQAFLL